jgi:hypothetical protein
MMWVPSTRGPQCRAARRLVPFHHRWRDCIAQTHAGMGAMAACSSAYGPTENARRRLTKMRSNMDLLQARRFELKHPRLMKCRFERS